MARWVLLVCLHTPALAEKRGALRAGGDGRPEADSAGTQPADGVH